MTGSQCPVGLQSRTYQMACSGGSRRSCSGTPSGGRYCNGSDSAPLLKVFMMFEANGV